MMQASLQKFDLYSGKKKEKVEMGGIAHLTIVQKELKKLIQILG